MFVKFVLLPTFLFVHSTFLATYKLVCAGRCCLPGYSPRVCLHFFSLALKSFFLPRWLRTTSWYEERTNERTNASCCVLPSTLRHPGDFKSTTILKGNHALFYTSRDVAAWCYSDGVVVVTWGNAGGIDIAGMQPLLSRTCPVNGANSLENFVSVHLSRWWWEASELMPAETFPGAATWDILVHTVNFCSRHKIFVLSQRGHSFDRTAIIS